jgi:hypothetical protein
MNAEGVVFFIFFAPLLACMWLVAISIAVSIFKEIFWP